MPSSRPSPPVILLLVIVVPLMLSSAPCGGSTARPDREGQPSFQPVPLGTDKFQSSGEALGDGHHDGQAQAAALPLAGPPEAPGHLLQCLRSEERRAGKECDSGRMSIDGNELRKLSEKRLSDFRNKHI